MKRKLSLIMVLMMVVSMIPTMPSFAASDNAVTSIVSVTSNGDTLGTNSPNLRIKNDKGDMKQGDIFWLELGDNAEWDSSMFVGGTTTSTTPATMTLNAGDVAIAGETINVNGTATAAITTTSTSQAKVVLDMKDVAGATLSVTINGAAHTLATGSSGATNAQALVTALGGTHNPVRDGAKVTLTDVAALTIDDTADNKLLIDKVNGVAFTTAVTVSPAAQDMKKINAAAIVAAITTAAPATVVATDNMNGTYTLKTTDSPSAISLQVFTAGTTSNFGLPSTATSAANAYTANPGTSTSTGSTATQQLYVPAGTQTSASYATIKRMSEKRAEVEITTADPALDDYLLLPLRVKFDGAKAGNQEVTVVPRNSHVSGGKYTYANVAEGKVTFRVDKKVKISRSGNQNVEMILDEVTRDSFKNGDVIALKLPNYFTWNKESLTGGAGTVAIDNSKDAAGRILNVTVNGADSNKLESIFFKADIVPSRDARYGDVEVTVTKGNDVSPNSLVVAEYVDYVGVVTVDKVLEVIAGKDDEKLYEAKLYIEEPVAGTLLKDRFIEVSFNKDVAAMEDGYSLSMRREKGNGSLLIDAGSSKALEGTSKASTANIVLKDNEKAQKESYKFDLYVDQATSGSNYGKYELKVPFVVSADATGDVELTFKGAGITEQKVVIAKAKAPVTVEIDKNEFADLKLGLQEQVGPDMYITETEAGALSSDTTYSIEFANNRYVMNWDSAKVEVVEGDLTLDKSKDEYGRPTDKKTNLKNKLEIYVDTKSKKASKLKVSGVKLTLDRSVPFGEFKLDYNFGAIKNNGENLTDTVVSKAYFNVVTPIISEENTKTVFTIDSMEYTKKVAGQDKKFNMDVAPYIKDGRTMMPIRFIAESIGVKVNWNSMTRQATFTKDATTAVISLDSDVMYVNGNPVKLYVKPEVKSDRMFIPLINVANAFGLEYDKEIKWDDAARTVTVFPDVEKANN